MFFATTTVITIRDLGAYYDGDMLRDENVEIVGWNSFAHYRFSDDTKGVELGGDSWGSLNQLLNLAVMQIGLSNGKMIITVED